MSAAGLWVRCKNFPNLQLILHRRNLFRDPRNRIGPNPAKYPGSDTVYLIRSNLGIRIGKYWNCRCLHKEY